MGLPRRIVAADDEISRAWDGLPRLLTQIPAQFRDELIARMCVATAMGLFDAAVNYVWNSAVIVLRQRIRDFGLAVVAQIKSDANFDEAKLVDLKDSELIRLCLDLDLVSEEGFFFLDQCRDIRNSYSVAHPPAARLDDAELIVFVSRVVKYAIVSNVAAQGVQVPQLLSALRSGPFAPAQSSEWINRLHRTHEAQRESIVGMLHGIYCDPASQEDARRNCMDICKGLVDQFSPKLKADLVSRHGDYVANGKIDKQTASQNFFNELSLLALLAQPEQHTLVVNASKRLLAAHFGWDNFHNERPFAERLLEVATQIAVPESAQPDFVEAVLTCAVGSQYGASWAAEPYYQKLVQSFSPREIGMIFELLKLKTIIVRQRLESAGKPRAQLKKVLSWINPDSVPTTYKAPFEALLRVAERVNKDVA